jgi:hypothetical protein
MMASVKTIIPKRPKKTRPTITQPNSNVKTANVATIFHCSLESSVGFAKVLPRAAGSGLVLPGLLALLKANRKDLSRGGIPAAAADKNPIEPCTGCVHDAQTIRIG